MRWNKLQVKTHEWEWICVGCGTCIVQTRHSIKPKSALNWDTFALSCHLKNFISWLRFELLLDVFSVEVLLINVSVVWLYQNLQLWTKSHRNQPNFSPKDEALSALMCPRYVIFTLSFKYCFISFMANKLMKK